MITPQQLDDLKALYPQAAVVCYVNSTAEIKAKRDICCTSANGVQVTNSLSEDEVIFVPDRNLAAYVARHTKKKIIPWDGYCYVHDHFTPEMVKRAKQLHPGAEFLAHPECRPEVIDLADFVYSTAGMCRHPNTSRAREFIIGTEVGMLYRLKKAHPDREFYPLSEEAICQNMKKTALPDVLRALRTLEPRIVVPEEIAVRARGAIERMLKVRV